MFFTSLQTGIPYYNLKKQEVDSQAVRLLPEWVCRKYHAIPLREPEASLIVVMDDPGDIHAVDELAAISKRHIEPALALRADIQEAIDRNYRVGSEIESELSRVPTMGGESGPDATSIELATAAVAEAPVVRAVDMLMRQAARDRASDIHIEPQDEHLNKAAVQRNGQRGFSLLEVLIALGILGYIGVGLMSALATGYRS